jgi:GntR family transcriptional repressor for pyruvate dehydrogenase complex
MSHGPHTQLKTLAPSRLVDDVVTNLRDYMLENDLESGARLPPERSLAEMMGTSRATVAQGLRILSVMGLVEIRHGSGIFVRRDPGALFGTTFDLMIDLEPGTVGQLAEFRYWIERSVLANRSVPAVDSDRLRRDFEALIHSKNRLDSWIEADAEFHVTLVNATANEFLTATYEMAHRKILSVSYTDWIERGSSPSWLRGERWTDQVQLHRRILDAALDGDAAGLATALAAHHSEILEHLARAVDLGST